MDIDMDIDIYCCMQINIFEVIFYNYYILNMYYNLVLGLSFL